jgi:hypothetical protein
MRIRISVNSPLKKLHRTTTKYDAVIVFAEVFNRAARNLLPHLRYAKRYGFVSTLEPGNRNMRIRSCPKAPLKNAKRHGFHQCPEPGYRKTQLALPGCVAVTVYSIVPNRATRDNRIGSCVNSPLKITP